VGSQSEGGARAKELEKGEGSSCEVLGDYMGGDTCGGGVVVVVPEEGVVVVTTMAVEIGVVGSDWVRENEEGA